MNLRDKDYFLADICRMSDQIEDLSERRRMILNIHTKLSILNHADLVRIGIIIWHDQPSLLSFQPGSDRNRPHAHAKYDSLPMRVIRNINDYVEKASREKLILSE